MPAERHPSSPSKVRLPSRSSDVKALTWQASTLQLPDVCCRLQFPDPVAAVVCFHFSWQGCVLCLGLALAGKCIYTPYVTVFGDLPAIKTLYTPHYMVMANPICTPVLTVACYLPGFHFVAPFDHFVAPLGASSVIPPSTLHTSP
jgi:hypothetical protein